MRLANTIEHSMIGLNKSDLFQKLSWGLEEEMQISKLT
jgi:hypothetical protein